MKKLLAAVSAVLLASGLAVATAPSAMAVTQVSDAAPTAVLAAAPNSSSFVRALYQDYLGRQPSASDITFWSAKLSAGSPRSVVATGFADSDEYRLIRIDNAYRTILGREPEAGGRASWLDGMHRGLLGTDDVEKAFYQSDEFYNRAGGADDRWISGLYQQVLGREAGPYEVTYWLFAGIRSHPKPPMNGYIDFDPSFDRGYVVLAIYSSVEAARSRVSVMYSTYFGRTPDETGVANWANFDLALGDAATRSGLTSSDEYYILAAGRYT